MPTSAETPRRLLIVDDDMLTREVLSLLATEAGFAVETCESGEEALEAVANSAPPDAILCDMQMSGITGDSLARLLRSACPAAALLAMSGTAVPAERTAAFDGFLLKPFSIEDLVATLDRHAVATPDAADAGGILSESIFTALSQSMKPQQVRQLYTLSLDDAEARVATLRKAAAAGDAAAYRAAAHSIKGGCGMVGALELARIAGRMEEQGPPSTETLQAIDNPDPCEEFLAASAHLRRILDAQLKY